MKRVMFFTICILFLLPGLSGGMVLGTGSDSTETGTRAGAGAGGVTGTESGENQEMDELKDILSEVDPVLGEDVQPDKIVEGILNGEGNVSPSSIWKGLLNLILKELSGEITLILSITAIAYIFSCISAVYGSTDDPKGQAALFAAVCAIAGVIGVAFYQSAGWAYRAMEEMELLMHSSIPILASVSLNVQSPAFIVTVQAAAFLMQKVFMPLALIHGAIGLIEGVTVSFPVGGLKNMLKSTFMWGLGITMTIFTGVMAISGAVGRSFTGTGSRTIKYAAGTMVPVVGRYLSEAADAVFASASVIKDAAGTGVMAAILMICAGPFIKILAVVLAFRLSIVFIQPVADERFVQAVAAAADSMTMVMGITALMGIFFVLNTAVLVSFGSAL